MAKNTSKSISAWMEAIKPSDTCCLAVTVIIDRENPDSDVRYRIGALIPKGFTPEELETVRDIVGFTFDAEVEDAIKSGDKVKQSILEGGIVVPCLVAPFEERKRTPEMVK